MVRYDSASGGAFGLGLPRKFREGYQFLSDNYDTGDEVWLPAEPRPACDFRGPDAFPLEPDDFGSLSPNCRHTTLIAALTLGLGDALPLPLWHGLPFGLSHCAGQQAGRHAGIQRLAAGHGQHPQADLLGSKAGDDLQQVANQPCQPIQLGDEFIFCR